MPLRFVSAAMRLRTNSCIIFTIELTEYATATVNSEKKTNSTFYAPSILTWHLRGIVVRSAESVGIVGLEHFVKQLFKSYVQVTACIGGLLIHLIQHLGDDWNYRRCLAVRPKRSFHVTETLENSTAVSLTLEQNYSNLWRLQYHNIDIHQA